MRAARGNASGAQRARSLAASAAALGSLLALAMPAPARAEVKPVNCANLQAAITSLGVKLDHGEGDTLVLGELCTAASLGLGGSGVTIPAKVGFTLQAAPGTTAGIDGTGISGSLLRTAGFEAGGAISLEGLTFEHASTSGASAVSLRASRVTIQGDSFLENTEEGVTAAALFVFAGEPSGSTCPPAGGAPAYVLRNSTLRGNRLTVASGAGGGGAAFLEDQCPGASHLIEGNAVEGNVLRSKGSTELLGGGVEAASTAPEPAPLTQRANIFSGNRIEDEAGVGDFGGGGEWLTGLSLSSVADRFSGNSIAGTGGGHWSWGGGLGILACLGTTRDVSTLEGAIVAANSIVGGTPAEDNGAGIYVGFGCLKTATSELSLIDSTVTANSAPAGGTAGVTGGPADELVLGNSILAGDLGGGELSGFAGGGGSISSSFSDACTPGTTSPLPGAGNICAAPHLLDEGNPASADVRETEASPTLDAGANGLVPAGLTTDYFGGPRILDAVERPGCGAALPNPPQVDMGAAEYGGTVLRGPAPPCVPPIRAHSKFTFPTLHVGRGGRVTLTFRGLSAGKLTIVATCRTTRTIVTRRGGKKHTTHRTETVPYAHATLTSSATSSPLKAGALAVTLKPGKLALSLLRRKHTLRVTLKITFTQPGLLPTAQAKSIFVRYSPLRRAKH